MKPTALSFVAGFLFGASLTGITATLLLTADEGTEAVDSMARQAEDDMSFALTAMTNTTACHANMTAALNGSAENGTMVGWAGCG